MAYKLYYNNQQIKKVYAPGAFGGSLENVAHVAHVVGTLPIGDDGRSWYGFTSKNFLTLNQPLNIGKNDYEFYFFVHLQASSKMYQILIDSFPRNRFSFGFERIDDNNWRLHSNWADGTTWLNPLNGTSVLPVGKNYHVMCKRVNGVRYLYLREDVAGAGWNLEGSVADTGDMPSSVYRIGKTTANEVYEFNGFINKSSRISTSGHFDIKKIYRGSQLVWQGDPYEPGSLLFYQTGAANFETDLEAGVYDLIIAGGGGQGYSWNYGGLIFHNGGGSGAAWEGSFYNPVKQHCRIYAGGKSQDSFLELGGVRMITAQAGQPHQGGSTGTGGPGGIITVNSALQIVQQRKSSNGNQGARGEHNENPTPSVCSINNWGQGSWTHGDNPGWIAGGARFEYLRLDR